MWRLAPSIAKDILQFCEGVGILKNFRIVSSLEKKLNIWYWNTRTKLINSDKKFQITQSLPLNWLLLKFGCRSWTWTLVTDSDKIWNMKNLDPENLDPEKTGPWNADAKITECRKTISRPHSMICWYWKSIKKTLSKCFEKVIVEAS